MERALNRRTNEEETHENYHNMDQSKALKRIHATDFPAALPQNHVAGVL